MDQTDQRIPGNHHRIECHNRQIHDAEVDDGFPKCRRGKHKGKCFHIGFKHLGHQDGHQLGSEYADGQSHRQGDQSHQHGLADQNAGNLALSHAQRHINAKLPFSSFHQKIIGIDDQKGQNDGDKHRHASQKMNQQIHHHVCGG